MEKNYRVMICDGETVVEDTVIAGQREACIYAEKRKHETGPNCSISIKMI